MVVPRFPVKKGADNIRVASVGLEKEWSQCLYVHTLFLPLHPFFLCHAGGGWDVWE